MNDEKIARRMQQQILGPRRFMAACGCVGIVELYFPKKPWVYVEDWSGEPCQSVDWSTATSPHLPTSGWYDKETSALVPEEQFMQAWMALKDRGKSVVSSGRDKYYICADGTINLEVWRPRKEEVQWPPKMGELFKKHSR